VAGAETEQAQRSLQWFDEPKFKDVSVFTAGFGWFLPAVQAVEVSTFRRRPVDLALRGFSFPPTVANPNPTTYR